jgi:hypothetical protein
VVVRVAELPTFTSVTVAPGTTDPDWSLTVPTIDPKVDWPIAGSP